ncbi:MAG: nitrous oxide reductase family maturation protein NosD [Bacteroidia bacterium]
MKNKLLYVFLFVCQLGLAKEIEVCKSCNLQSIGTAVELAEDGDLITVKEGVYKEHGILINKPLSLQAEGEVTIDGENIETIINIESDGVEVSGFHLINVGQSYTKEYAAIHILRSDSFSIHHNKLEKVFFGMLIEKCHQGKVYHNTITSDGTTEAGSGNGIHLWHCDNVSIHDNKLSGLRDGIYFEFVDSSEIYNNYSHNNLRYGLHFMFSNSDNYHHNTFQNNGAGVAVMFSKKINMHQNRFLENWGTAAYGLLLKEIYDAEITNNRFEQNTIGINVEGSSRVNYQYNDFVRNGWAAKIVGACYANSFKDNNFLYNSFDLSYNSKMNDNEFIHNFWSEYSGYDLDKDGIGDVPYRPVKLFSYIVNQTPEAIVLLRSLFVFIINFSEKVSPIFTPDHLVDPQPLMKAVNA